MDHVVIRAVGRELGYHVSPTKNGGDIQQNGFRGPVYIWKDKSFADWYRDTEEDPEVNENPDDLMIWIIDVAGLEMKRDPETEDMGAWSSRFKEGEFGEGYIYDGNIPSDRIVGRD